MKDSLYLAWRYVVHHRVKTGLLVSSLAVFIGLPLVLRELSSLIQQSLVARAQSTPLLLGKKGSSLDLVIEALYFETKAVEALTQADVEALNATALTRAIPIRTGLVARGQPVVGTSFGYFAFRGLQVAKGRMLATLGECVLGAEAAKTLGLAPGDTLLTAPSALFDLAGVYPLNLQVVGVLAQSHGPDDRGVFVDTKTAWVAEGLGHGHQDLQGAASDVVLKREADTVIANAKLVQYNEITDENLESFHFHGDPSMYPVSAIIAVPNDNKAGTLLRGRFIDDPTRQLVRPREVVEGLNATIFRFERILEGIVLTVGLATALLFLLVMVLSWRLRSAELRTMTRLGCSQWKTAQILGSEVALMIGASVVLAALLAWFVAQNGDVLLRFLVLQG